jgi:hypothetical protein
MRRTGMSVIKPTEATLTFKTRRSDVGWLKVTTPSTLSPKRYVDFVKVNTATMSPSLAISNEAGVNSRPSSKLTL